MVNDVLKLTTTYVNDIAEAIEELLKDEILANIKTKHGRDKNSSECCRQSSSVYYLYNDEDEIIYIGQTGASVKKRLYGHTGGSHSKKAWFSEVDRIRYYSNPKMDDLSRKTIERALIQKHNPKYNDGE